MIKCKDGGCPKKKDICCRFCEEKDECKGCCVIDDPVNCDEAIVEQPDALELFKQNHASAILIIQDIEQQKKELEEREKGMRVALKQAMETYGITKFENDVIRITYTGEHERNTIDSKALKLDHPKIAKKYTKTSTVASSISIKLKG